MNPYEELEVDVDASDKEIKSAYKKKAQKHHPDKGGDKEKFMMIKLSYDVLSNAKKREKFDKTGDIDEQSKTDSKLEEHLEQLFSAVIQNCNFKGDIITESKALVDSRIASLNSEIKKSKVELRKYQKNRFRMKTENDRNIYLEIIDKNIYILEQKISDAEEEVSICEQIIVELKKYNDEEPQNKEEEQYWRNNFIYR